MSRNQTYKQSVFYIGSVTLALVLIALSFLSYSRATLGTNRIKEIQTVLGKGQYELVLRVDPVQEGSRGYGHIDLLLYDAQNGTPAMGTELRAVITKVNPEQWPFPGDKDVVTLYDRQLMTDHNGHATLDQRFDYADKSAERTLEVTLPSGEKFTQRLD